MATFLLRKDRVHKTGGGVVMYIRNGIHFKPRPELEKTTQAFMVFKATNKKTPSYITNMFQPA